MKNIYATCLFLLFVKVGFSQSQLMIGNTQVQVDTVITGIDVPWEIQYGPDGYLWFTERIGRVSRLDPVTKARTIVLDITSEVYQEYEAGLLGMALHPDFAIVPEVFIVYTYGSDPNVYEKVVKYTYDGTALINPIIVLDNINGFTTHNGSRLIFLPDNTLLMSTGDAQDMPTAQNSTTLNGKTLRMNMDGSIPLNNPNPTTYMYTMGHRNIQGIHRAPDGKIYISEHGPNNDDELQILIAGDNYGWPDVEGFCNLPEEQEFCDNHSVHEPLVAWTPTIAPSDLIYYANSAFPELDNKLVMTVLKDKMLAVFTLGSDGNTVNNQVNYLNNQFGRLRDICTGPQKEIYLATNGSSWQNVDPNTHSIIRITPPTDASVLDISRVGYKLYPNPVQDILTVEMKANLLGTELMITDLQSKVVLRQKIESSKFTVDLTKFDKGMYYVNVNGKIESIMVD